MSNSNAVENTDILAQARAWARQFSDPSKPLDPLVGIDVDTATSRDKALEKIAVLMFQQLVESCAIEAEVVAGHPMVDGLVSLYAHKDASVALRKRLGTRTIRLQDDADFDVAKRVQQIADASDRDYDVDVIVGALSTQLKLTAGQMDYDDRKPFFDQYFGAATGCQRALAVAAVLEVRGLLG